MSNNDYNNILIIQTDQLNRGILLKKMIAIEGTVYLRVIETLYATFPLEAKRMGCWDLK